MTLTQLRYLVAIIDAGFNVTLAASRLGATQPGLSKQLKQMEDELGFQMFRRKGRSFAGLSLGGAKIAERARIMLGEAENIRALARNHRGETHGNLRLAVGHADSGAVLAETLIRLRAAHPGVAVRLTTCADGDAVQRLALDQADLAMVSGPRPEAPGVALPVYRSGLTALVREDHPLARLVRPVSPTDLAAYPLVTDEASPHLSSLLLGGFAAEPVQPNIIYAASDPETIKTWVLAGAGVGVVPEPAVGDLRGLQPLELGHEFALHTTWIIFKPGRVLPVFVLDWLSEIAPHVGRRDLRRVLDGADATWPQAPHWRDVAARLRQDPAQDARKVVPFSPSPPSGPARRRQAR